MYRLTETRRRVLLGFPAALAAGVAGTSAVLAACSSSSGGATAGGLATAEPNVKLTYLHQWSQTQGHGPATDEMVRRFQAQFPAIQVEATYVANYYEKLAAVIAGGDLPDVVTYNLAFLPRLIRQGVVVPAETLAKGQYRFDRNDLVPVARDMVTFDGKIMDIPYVLNSSGLAYNVTLYKQRGLDPRKPPTTWTELVDQARQLTFQQGDQQIWGTQFPKGTADPISPLLAFLWQNGGEVVDMKKLEPVWNSAPAVESLQFQVDLVQKYRVASVDQPGDPKAGQVGIWHIPPGNVAALGMQVKDAFEWSTAELPKGKQKATSVGGHSLAVLKTSHQEQAWRFVHFFIQPANLAAYLVATTTLPPWRSAEQHQTWQQYVRDEPRIKPFVEMLSYARPTPKLTRWQDIVDILARARDDTGAQKRTPQAALDDAAREAAPLVKEG